MLKVCKLFSFFFSVLFNLLTVGSVAELLTPLRAAGLIPARYKYLYDLHLVVLGVLFVYVKLNVCKSTHVTRIIPRVEKRKEL